MKFGPTGQPGLRIFRFGTRESKDIFILEIILILHTNIIGTLIHILRYPIILLGSILIERFYCSSNLFCRVCEGGRVFRANKLGDEIEIGAGNGRAFVIRVFTLGHARTFSITMSPDITCIKNGTIIMALHKFEYLPR